MKRNEPVGSQPENDPLDALLARELRRATGVGPDVRPGEASAPGRDAEVTAEAIDRVVGRAMDRVRQHRAREREPRRGRRRFYAAAAAAALVAAALVAAIVRNERSQAPPPPLVDDRNQTAEPKRENPPSRDKAYGANDSSSSLADVLERPHRDRRELLKRIRRDAPASFAELEELVLSGPRDAAIEAAWLLARARSGAADRRIAELLHRVADHEVAMATLSALAERRDGAATELLSTLFADERAAGHLKRFLAGGARSERVVDIACTSPLVELRTLAISLLSVTAPARAAERVWTELMDHYADASRTPSADAGNEVGAGGADAVAFLRTALPALSSTSRNQLARLVRGDSLRASVRAQRGCSGERLARWLAAARLAESWPLLAALLEVERPTAALIAAAGASHDLRALAYLERFVHLDDARGTAAIHAIARLPGRTALERLTKTYHLKRGAGALSSAAIAALTSALRSRGNETLEHLDHQLARGAREEAIDLLVDVFPDAATPRLVALIDDEGELRDRIVRGIVVRSLGRLRTPQAIGALLDALDEPRLATDAHAALRRLTQRDFGRNPDAWKRWLRASDLLPPVDAESRNRNMNPESTVALKTALWAQEEA